MRPESEVFFSFFVAPFGGALIRRPEPVDLNPLSLLHGDGRDFFLVSVSGLVDVSAG